MCFDGRIDDGRDTDAEAPDTGAGDFPGRCIIARREATGPRSHSASDDDLFTAPEVARFCKVDLKTIHNWVDRDQIEHFRTPGRHLRFRRKDVYDFLKRFDYPIPPELVPPEPGTFVLTSDPQLGSVLRRQLADLPSMEVYDDVLDLLLRAGEQPPEVIVMDGDSLDVELSRLRRALDKRDGTRGCRLLMIVSDLRAVPPGQRGLVDAWVDRDMSRQLRDTLDTLMGE